MRKVPPGPILSAILGDISEFSEPCKPVAIKSKAAIKIRAIWCDLGKVARKKMDPLMKVECLINKVKDALILAGEVNLR